MPLAVHLPTHVIVSSFVKPLNFCSSISLAANYNKEDFCAHELMRTNSSLKQGCVLKETNGPCGSMGQIEGSHETIYVLM